MFSFPLRYLCCCLLYCALTPALAADPPPKSPWDGSNAHLGLVLDTGNSDDLDINSGLNLQYTQENWSNDFQATAQVSRSSGELSKEKYFFGNQWDYAFGDQSENYYFLNANFTEDKFSAYKYQLVASTGYGHKFINTDKLLFSVQAGPGLRRDKEADTDQVSNHTIITTGSTLKWRMTDTTTLGEVVTFDIGRPYDYMKSVMTLSNEIISNLAIQVSYTVEYYSDIPPHSTNTEKTDTTTNVALVYSF